MKKVIVLVLLFLAGSVFIHAQNAAPDWINKDPFVKDGIIYFSGYARMSTMSLSMQTAQSRAFTNLMRYLNSNTSQRLPSIPADAEVKHTFTYERIEGTISGVKVVENWTDDSRGVHILCSCDGVEIKRN